MSNEIHGQRYARMRGVINSNCVRVQALQTELSFT